ncbi:Integrase [Theobroma cacao]|nr:Integrase [Theobroma cacao]
MIAKSHTEKDHTVNLKKLFERLRKFQVKLNPAKCTFGVTSGKLLGFIVSEKGIEVDPDKIRAIQELPPPKTQKEVRGFLGRLNYIARFISQLTCKCDPIFKLLRKRDPGEWNEECQIAFDKIKEYLTNPPVLMPPTVEKPLILYLTVNKDSMGCVLGQHDETWKKERVVYYLSKKFMEYESKYSALEKMCCALAWTAQRLRQYMLYHTTWLVAKLDPIKYIFEKPSLSRRIARWQVLLSEYDIVYVSQKSIKGSAIADFLADRANEDYESVSFNFSDEDLMAVLHIEEVGPNELNPWKVYFDGASNALGHGIGAVLISPKGKYYPATARLNFNCTNNMAEYEALVMGLQAAIEMKADTIDVYGDSALVICQMKGEWETRDPKLVPYKKLVTELSKQFKEISFNHLPREENQIADALATLAAMFKIKEAADLLRKRDPGEWNEECQIAFDKIKEYLTNPSVLMPPTVEKPLILYLTVNRNSMGCVLGQHDETGKKERAVYYLSKKFMEYESKYSALEKMCCALAWTAQRLRQYMLYHTTWLVAKLDPIKIARWQVLLSEYDIVYVSQKSIKGSAIADFLADRANEDYESVSFDFPDEDLMAVLHIEEVSPNELNPWKVYFDGASNALGHGIGAVLISPNGKYYPATTRLNFNCTNNMAEYEALVMGLQAAIEMKVDAIDVYGDSALVICQMKGEWETRDPKLVPYKKLVTELSKQFKEISFNHLPREENQIADALATLAAMFKIKEAADVRPFDLEVREVSAHCLNVEEEVDGKPWYHDIMQYIKHQTYPENVTDNDKRTLRRLAMGFFLSGEVLYKKSRDQVLLRCVDVAEANKIMKEVHEGTCGAHANGHMLARQIMRAGYYWLTLESDCINFARKCHKCQVYADRIHAPPAPLHVFTAPWPFSMWGMDVIGLITPKASNGHRFILVAIDYFTKWVEAASYANVTQKVVCKFIQKEIICRYGLPERIITDNASNLNGAMVKDVCTKFKIKHHNSTTYRPKMNGAVEAANKNIKKIVEKMTEVYKDWHEKLPFALHAYRTSVRTSTGATPYSLVYGAEAVLPVEVEIPSLRVLMETELEDAEWVRSRYEQLNLIEEKRLAALCHGQMYQRRMMRAYEKKVHPRQFREGELVLKRILPNQTDFRGKWMPNWEGPYVVKKAFSGGALILANMDGGDLPNPINADAVKKYYA